MDLLAIGVGPAVKHCGSDDRGAPPNQDSKRVLRNRNTR